VQARRFDHATSWPVAFLPEWAGDGWKVGHDEVGLAIWSGAQDLPA